MSVADKRRRFDSVTWDREKNPFLRLWIENREEVDDSRLFIELRSDTPSESQLMVGLNSSGPDGNDSVQLSLKILNRSIASIIPQMVIVEPENRVRVWLIPPSNNPPSRVFCKLIDEDGMIHGSTECNMEDHLDGDAMSSTKVVTMKIPLSALTKRQVLVARLFDETEKELGSFQMLIPTD